MGVSHDSPLDSEKDFSLILGALYKDSIPDQSIACSAHSRRTVFAAARSTEFVFAAEISSSSLDTVGLRVCNSHCRT